MATTFTWDCRTVDVRPTQDELTNVVYNVHWRYTGNRVVEEETYSYTIIGTQNLTTETIQPEGFIPFDQLTHVQVIAWVEEALGEERITMLQGSVDQTIDNMITPVSVTRVIEEPVIEEPVVEEPTPAEGEPEAPAE